VERRLQHRSSKAASREHGAPTARERHAGQSVAIKFTEQDEPRGMDILLHYGPARMLPQLVYLTTQGQLARAIPPLLEAGVSFMVRDDLPKRLALAQARVLAESEGWKASSEDEAGEISPAPQPEGRSRRKHLPFA